MRIRLGAPLTSIASYHWLLSIDTPAKGRGKNHKYVQGKRKEENKTNKFPHLLTAYGLLIRAAAPAIHLRDVVISNGKVFGIDSVPDVEWCLSNERSIGQFCSRISLGKVLTT